MPLLDQHIVFDAHAHAAVLGGHRLRAGAVSRSGEVRLGVRRPQHGWTARGGAFRSALSGGNEEGYRTFA